MEFWGDLLIIEQVSRVFKIHVNLNNIIFGGIQITRKSESDKIYILKNVKIAILIPNVGGWSTSLMFNVKLTIHKTSNYLNHKFKFFCYNKFLFKFMNQR